MTSTIPVLLRGVAWSSMTGATGCAIVLGGIGVALARSSVGPTLLTGAFTLLAAAAALTLDEPASAVVDVTPTRLAQRTAARGCALSVPLAAGVAIAIAVLLRNPRLSTAALLLAGVGNVLVGFAAACLGRRRSSEPGAWAAIAVILALVVLPQLGPDGRRVHTFPAPAGTPGLSATSWWSLAIALSLLTIAVTSYAGQPRLPDRDGPVAAGPVRPAASRTTQLSTTDPSTQKGTP